MAEARALPPVWLMGLGFLPLGVTGTVMLLTIPTLLASNHVPEPQIAGVTAIGLIPGFCSFVLVAAAGLAVQPADLRRRLRCRGGALHLRRPDVTDLSRPALMAAVCQQHGYRPLRGGGGRLVRSLTRKEDGAALGAWFTVANLGGGGFVAGIAIYLLRDPPYVAGAGVIGLLAVAALPLFFWVPCPPADGRLAGESFRDFARDVLAILRKSSVLWTLLLFLAPAASFALTNTLSGMGRDFHTPEKLVGLIGGAGVLAAGIVGSLLVPRISRGAARGRSICSWAVSAPCSAPPWFSCPIRPRPSAWRCSARTSFRPPLSGGEPDRATLGGSEQPAGGNPVRPLNAASSLPLTYMQVIDGQAYGIGGVNGSYLADAGISGGVCLILALTLADLPPPAAGDPSRRRTARLAFNTIAARVPRHRRRPEIVVRIVDRLHPRLARADAEERRRRGGAVGQVVGVGPPGREAGAGAGGFRRVRRSRRSGPARRTAHRRTRPPARASGAGRNRRRVQGHLVHPELAQAHGLGRAGRRSADEPLRADRMDHGLGIAELQRDLGGVADLSPLRHASARASWAMVLAVG